MIPGTVEAAAAHLDIFPQITVSTNMTVRTTERAATSAVHMVTPLPATPESSDYSIVRTAVSGPPSEAFISALNAKLWVNPTTVKPTVGKLTSYTAQQLASPPGRGTPYPYELSYADTSGLVPPQAGYINPYPYPMRHLPGEQIRYVGGNVPATMWGDYYRITNAARQYVDSASELMHVLPAGAKIIDSWNQYPLHPVPNVNPDPASLYDSSLPSAAREGDTLTLSVTPFGDNQPGHYAPGFTQPATSGSYLIDQNGKTVAGGKITSGPAGSGAFTTQAALSPDPSTITFKLNASRSGPFFPLSTATSTVWTWRSVHESGDTLPRGWYCDDATSSSHCGVEPSLMVQVSFDDGTHWQLARVVGAGGTYHVAFTAPAGTYITLRTKATDAAGGSITESITRAYRTAP
jgi:hypothetical protein